MRKYPNWFKIWTKEYFYFTPSSFLCALLPTGWVVFQVRIFSQLTSRSSSRKLAEFKQAVKHRTVLSNVDCKITLAVSYARALTKNRSRHLYNWSHGLNFTQPKVMTDPWPLTNFNLNREWFQYNFQSFYWHDPDHKLDGGISEIQSR